MLLEKFKTAKQPEIQALRQLEYINMLPLSLRIERPSFLNALCAPNGNRPHVIAEFKRASPFAGGHPDGFPAGRSGQAVRQKPVLPASPC